MQFIYFCTICCLFLLWRHDFVQGSPSPNLSSILDKLLANYDKRVHPYHGKRPVNVGVSIFVISLNINDIDRVMRFTASIYLRQRWQDERLAYNTTDENGNKNMCIELQREDREKIWLPDTVVINEIDSFIHQVTAPNKFMRICPSGSIAQSTRITLTASCPMNFKFFPFDKQKCEIGVQSYNEDATQLVYKWSNSKNSVSISEDVSDPIFKIGEAEPKELGGNSEGNDFLLFDFSISRNWKGYKQTFFYPMILFSCLSLVSTWAVQHTIGTVLNLINFGVLNLFMALVGNGSEHMKRNSVDSTAMDLYFCITNGTVLVCFFVSLIGIYLDTGINKGLNFLGDEVPRSQLESYSNANDLETLTDQEYNIDGDSQNLILDSNLSTRADVNMLEKIRHWCEMSVQKICFKILQLAVTLLYIGFNISYWNYYPFQ